MERILVKDIVARLLKMPQDMEVIEPFEDIGMQFKRNLPTIELYRVVERDSDTCFDSFSCGDDKSLFKKYCKI